MIKEETTRRYSKSLLELDTSSEGIKEKIKDLNLFLDLLRNKELGIFFYSPIISEKEKESILRKHLEGIIDEQLFNFLLLLLKKNRISQIDQIAQEYTRIAKEKLGILEARILTVIPIDEKEKNNLKEHLEEFLQRRIEIKEEIVPSLIGGIVLIFGSQMVDSSIKNKLELLKENLIATKL